MKKIVEKIIYEKLEEYYRNNKQTILSYFFVTDKLNTFNINGKKYYGKIIMVDKYAYLCTNRRYDEYLIKNIRDGYIYGIITNK